MPKQLSTPSLGTHSNPHRIRSVGWNNIHLMSHGQTPYVVSGWPIYPQLKIVSKSLLKPVLSTTLEIWTMTHTHTHIHTSASRKRHFSHSHQPDAPGIQQASPPGCRSAGGHSCHVTRSQRFEASFQPLFRKEESCYTATSSKVYRY